MWWCLYHIFGANIRSNFWTLTLLFWILQLIRFEQNEMWRMLVMAKFEYVKCNEFQLHSFWHDPEVIVISQKLEQTPGLCPVKLNFHHPNLVYHKHVKCYRLWTPLGFLHGTFYSQSHDLSWHWFCIFSLQFWQQHINLTWLRSPAAQTFQLLPKNYFSVEEASICSTM